jgi:hypothetical protein
MSKRAPDRVRASLYLTAEALAMLDDIAGRHFDGRRSPAIEWLIVAGAIIRDNPAMPAEPAAAVAAYAASRAPEPAP